jgi:23S rRNA (cytosine1962-C5)-methyltransferase
MQALLDAIAATPLTTEACRIFHGRGGLHPGCEGWTLDAYPPVWVFTSFEPADDALLAAVHQALQARWATLAPGAALHWVYQCRHPQQRETRTMAGQVPEPHVVQEDGARYLVHVLRGQNHGLFLDMAEGRRWVQRHAAQHPGLRVLNLFAYTCAFSVAALRAGAAQVVNVDMAGGALTTGRQNHRLNGRGGRRPVLGPRHLQLLGQDHAPWPLRPGHHRPAQLPERQLRRHQGLRAPAAPPARPAGAPAATPCCASTPPNWTAISCASRCRSRRPRCNSSSAWPTPPPLPTPSPERALKVLVYRRRGERVQVAAAAQTRNPVGHRGISNVPHENIVNKF